MDYLSILQINIDYIESNLSTELNPEDLAYMSGFSLSHYYRLFLLATGKSVMEYILRRRLIHAIYHISLGEKMIDVAFTYGFNTYAGFYKAFIKEFHTSPRNYMNNNPISKPYPLNLFNKENIMLSHKKIREVLSNWDIPVESIQDIYYNKNGMIKDNSWTINNDLLLKVGTNIQQLKSHLKISQLLNESGIQASVPIVTKENQAYYVDNDIYYYLSKKLDGTPIESGDCYRGDYLNKAIIMGNMIGKLHLVLDSLNDELLIREVDFYETLINWAIPKTKNILNLDETFYQDYIEEFHSIYAELKKQVIHRNPNPSNIIVKEGNLLGFTDFNFTEINVRIFDPCYLSTAILSESFEDNDEDKLLKWTHIYKNIMKGYDEIVTLTPFEKKAIPYIIYGIQFIFITYLDNKSEDHTQMRETNKKMLMWLVNHRELLEL